MPTIRLDELDRAIAGRVLHPDAPDYDAARQTFNATIDRRPAAIVTCRTIDDVVAAVRAARAAGLPIAVRGGGHGVAGHAMADGALVVDLREMRDVTVDPQRRRARVAGGAQWEDLDRAAFEHGLATTGGTFWDTGVGGLTLSGGIGVLMGTIGFTCDNLMRAVVVTADGEIVVAGAGGDPDLLWALRGGGGNFGVVTEFEFLLHPLPELQDGRFAVPLGQATVVLEAVDAAARSGPPELLLMVVGPAPERPTVAGQAPSGPAEYLIVSATFQGSKEDASAAVAAITSLPGVTGEFVTRTYLEIQGGSALLPFGLRHYWKGHFLRELDAASMDVVVGAMRDRLGPMSFMLLEAISGRARDEPPGGASFGQRGARWNASALAIWEDPADDDAQIAWARRAAEGLLPASFSGAGYGNYASVDETPERVRAGFSADRFDRLRHVKRRYDPDNMFRFNHNIPPAD
ncbi:MAG TPA: FAD-binding oxidoreductase [Candidatus Saccharimonadales bacterium]|nr:FAD-binding oxidoreductase [Candidatus Saccharimonadales bacterium]